MTIEPLKRGVRQARSNRNAILAAAFALAVIFLGAWVSHQWDTDAGLNVLYVVLALAVVALAFPFTRSFLADATNVKLPGGLEITRQLADAIETIKGLPVVDENKELSSRPLKVIDAAWHEDPAKALSDLRAKLKVQIAWLLKELYPPSARHGTDRAAIKQLEDDDLISAQEARISKAILGISGRVLARGYDSDSEGAQDTVVAFMEGADSIATQLRLIALDNQVRKALKERGFEILDYEDQPDGRWPDFYAFDPEHRDKPLRMTVRMARTRNSTLIGETRKRMRKKRHETPLDDQVQRVIVVPKTSRSKLDDDPDEEIRIPAVKRSELEEWIDNHLSGEDG